MKRLAFVLVVSALAGCASTSSKESPSDLLFHTVKIPAKYRGGDPWPGYDGDSKRYCYTYENAWWACVESFARDIDHQVTVSDKAGNGWPVELDGYWDGYSDAEKRVQAVIRKFGKQEAQEIFRKALRSPDA